jgi:hypothetical protein
MQQDVEFAFTVNAFSVALAAANANFVLNDFLPFI